MGTRTRTKRLPNSKLGLVEGTGYELARILIERLQQISTHAREEAREIAIVPNAQLDTDPSVRLKLLNSAMLEDISTLALDAAMDLRLVRKDD